MLTQSPDAFTTAGGTDDNRTVGNCSTSSCTFLIHSTQQNEENLSPGGVLGLKKGTDCGPTAAERWLLRPKMA